MNNFLYRAGDKVKCAFFGDKVFTLIEKGFSNYLYIEKYGCSLAFYLDGRFEDDHTHSILTLVERPKTKVEFIVWVNIFPNNYRVSHNSKHSADRTIRTDRITCVELKGEYEI